MQEKPTSPQCAAAQQQTKADCRTAADGVQKIVLLKPASPPRAAAQQPTKAYCQTTASRVQKIVSIEPASAQRAAAQQPTEACPQARKGEGPVDGLTRDGQCGVTDA